MDGPRTLIAAAEAAVARGDLAGAENGYRAAIARYGARAEWLASLGALLVRGRRVAEALPPLEAAAAALPGHAGVLSTLGYALLETGRRADAIVMLGRALQIDPAKLDALNNLGRAHAAAGDLAAAGAAFGRALDIAPTYVPALSNWCDALVLAGDVAGARDVAARAAQAAPEHAPAWFKYGFTLMLTDEFDAARDALARAAAIDARHPRVEQNLGTVALWQNRLDDAAGHFRAELQRDPRAAEARFGLAAALLKLRRGDEGWQQFEARLELAPAPGGGAFRLPAWDGRALQDGALLVLPEEGLGDVLQFVRFVADARRRVGRVLLWCDDYWGPVARLVATAPGLDAVVDRASAPQAVAAQCRIMSLPRVLGLGNEAFAERPPYLQAPPADVARWAPRVARHAGLRVGLCWGGHPHLNRAGATRLDDRRSVPPARLAPLWDVPGIAWFSLQKHPQDKPPVEVAALPLVDWTAEFTDYADTAALMANLDLVISVDTSVIHCAGATGRPVWLLDRSDNCWRWGTDAGEPGSYPTLRAFRQTTFGDWTPVIAAVAAALGPLAREHATRPAAAGG
jgi:tetratricopeptide (TPR) repeat protein